MSDVQSDSTDDEVVREAASLLREWKRDKWTSGHGDKVAGLLTGLAVRRLYPLCRKHGISEESLVDFMLNPSAEGSAKVDRVMTRLSMAVEHARRQSLSAGTDDPTKWVSAAWIDENTWLKSSSVRASISKGASIRKRQEPGGPLLYFLPDIERIHGHVVKRKA